MRKFVLAGALLALLAASCRPTDPPETIVPIPPPPRQSSSRPAPALSLSPFPRSAPPAPFPSELGTISAITQDRLPYSWREGCPVPVEDLRLVSVTYWGFDDKPHNGQLVVHRAETQKILRTMQQLLDQRFPIDRMELIDKYRGDDDRSMEANNTSAFNCREVEGKPGSWSEHAYGRAIDINPVQNPHVSRSGEISPPGGAAYADRSERRKGMIHAGDPVVLTFRRSGWQWGGNWSGAKDYQHFSATGR